MGGGGGSLDTEETVTPEIPDAFVRYQGRNTSVEDAFERVLSGFASLANNEAPLNVTFRRETSEKYTLSIFHEDCTVKRLDDIYNMARAGNENPSDEAFLLSLPFAVSHVDDRCDAGITVEESGRRRDMLVEQTSVELLRPGSSLFRHPNTRRGSQLSIYFSDNHVSSVPIRTIDEAVRSAGASCTHSVEYTVFRGHDDIARTQTYG